jgi:hypothetical protein
MNISGMMVSLGLLSAVFGTAAAAEERPTPCGPFGKYAPMREISGEIVRLSKGQLGTRGIIVKDANSKCLVFVATNNANCVLGKSYSATGHIRSLRGEDHDATFHNHLSNTDTSCR